MTYKIAAASLWLMAAPLAAQTTVVQPVAVAPAQNVTVVPQAVTGNVLRAGSAVPVALSEFLTTKGKTLTVG